MAQETQKRALYQPRGVKGGGRWEGVSKGGDIWLIHDRKEQNSIKQLPFNKKNK